MTNKVTIGIPTYNRKDYLRMAIDSCLCQTYANIEIIVSDNCSTDGTDIMVAQIKDQRIKYFRHSKPVPPLENWNKCIELATGEFFSYLTDDDLIAPDYVTSLMDAAAAHPEAAVIRCRVDSIDSDGKLLGKIRDRLPEYASIKEYVLADIHENKWQTMGAAICETRLLRQSGGFENVGLPGGIYTDNYLWLKVALNGSRIITLQKSLFFFRVHTNHLGIGIDLNEVNMGARRYAQMYKALLARHGFENRILNYLDGRYAGDILKRRVGLNISRMIRGQIKYNRREITRNLRFMNPFFRLERWDVSILLASALLLINRKAAMLPYKLYTAIYR